jgi:hypothetical protein
VEKSKVGRMSLAQAKAAWKRYVQRTTGGKEELLPCEYGLRPYCVIMSRSPIGEGKKIGADACSSDNP